MLTHYVDANLMHDVTSGRSVTRIIHLLNKTPIDWYWKKHPLTGIGSEFVAARTCAEQIVDLRTTLYFLVVPVWDKSYMFIDNKSVVDSSMQVQCCHFIVFVKKLRPERFSSLLFMATLIRQIY